MLKIDRKSIIEFPSGSAGQTTIPLTVFDEQDLTINSSIEDSEVAFPTTVASGSEVKELAVCMSTASDLNLNYATSFVDLAVFGSLRDERNLFSFWSIITSDLVQHEVRFTVDNTTNEVTHRHATHRLNGYGSSEVNILEAQAIELRSTNALTTGIQDFEYEEFTLTRTTENQSINYTNTGTLVSVSFWTTQDFVRSLHQSGVDGDGTYYLAEHTGHFTGSALEFMNMQVASYRTFTVDTTAKTVNFNDFIGIYSQNYFGYNKSYMTQKPDVAILKFIA